MTKGMIIQKTRSIRTYDTSRAAIVEIPLQADEKPLNGQPLPQQGCNVEISKIQIAEEPRQWWTLGFEAFGDLDSAPGNLLKTTQFLIAHSFPLPICGEFLNCPLLAGTDQIVKGGAPHTSAVLAKAHQPQEWGRAG